MVRDDLIKFIQAGINQIITSNPTLFSGYTCNISGDINYEFLEPSENVIEASVFVGSATKNNDLEDKYNQKFTINIVSEANGGDVALKLFNLYFQTYTRTYFPNSSFPLITFDGFNGKMFLTSPVYMGKYQNAQSNFVQYMVMNGDLEFVKNVVLGATYTLTLGSGTLHEIPIKPRQPYCLKEAMGGIDTKPLSPALSLFTKSSNQLTINLVLIYEINGETYHDALFNTLLNECYASSTQNYTFKCVCGSETKTISNLICVRGQHIYDEATGENVLSLQFKQTTT